MKRVATTFVLCLLFACNKPQEKHQIKMATGGDPGRGKQLINQYGCSACHSIPGVEGPKGMVGPPLDHIAMRPFIAGKFQNNVANMTRWLQNPQSMDPQSAMPNLGVTPQDSSDIAAYLYTLK